MQIGRHLKPVALWATHLAKRTLFEWVWDGKEIHIVQADVAEPQGGTNPHTLLPTKIQCVEPSSLKVFRLADVADYDQYKKLQNVKTYMELGYLMPPFYIIDDPSRIESLLAGNITPEIDHDLAELTKRHLIIRTDGENIPDSKREMLPRSDELCSASQARDWLVNDFTNRIKEIGIENDALCLIAHHFIPSVASAWARAIPGNRIVRIESLWGLPEGLYWYSHDTYEVDTQSTQIDSDSQITSLKYTSSERLRYKEWFVAPDSDGNWIPCRTAQPYDWGKSIVKDTWLFEIAHTTRLVSERAGQAVALMWFIDNQPQATSHKILPWFHSKSELTGSPKAAPRHKHSGIKDFVINNQDDWARLKLVI